MIYQVLKRKGILVCVQNVISSRHSLSFPNSFKTFIMFMFEIGPRDNIPQEHRVGHGCGSGLRVPLPTIALVRVGIAADPSNHETREVDSSVRLLPS